jgi:hypothetical protein
MRELFTSAKWRLPSGWKTGLRGMPRSVARAGFPSPLELQEDKMQLSSLVEDGAGRTDFCRGLSGVGVKRLTLRDLEGKAAGEILLDYAPEPDNDSAWNLIRIKSPLEIYSFRCPRLGIGNRLSEAWEVSGLEARVEI